MDSGPQQGPDAEPGHDVPKTATCVSPSRQWRAFGASVIGVTHTRKGLPNQDAVRWYPADDGFERTSMPTVLAVADGHGEAACVRSELGSQFAVDIAVEVLRQFALDEQLRGGGGLADVRQFAHRLISRSVSSKWLTRVSNHHAQYPFTPTELLLISGGDKQCQPLEQKRIFKAYGTTLLAVLATDSYILGLQVGDGAILLVKSCGQSHLFIPPNPAHFANETTSLCSTPVDMAVEVQQLDGDSPVAAMLCTDGYQNAFEGEYFCNKLLSEYVEVFKKRHGWREIYRDLPPILEHASHKGSGDDATMGFIVSDHFERAHAGGDNITSDPAPAAPSESQDLSRSLRDNRADEIEVPHTEK
jgi:hypothetical protein